MKVIETKFYKINYSDSLDTIALQTMKILDKKIIEYKDFFNIDKLEKIIVNYFDNIDEFRNFIYNIRGERDSLPRYAQGTYDNGMVNAYINPNAKLAKAYTASHELFHILYMKYILKDNYDKRIVWYDEGMAQFMSGENDYLNNIFKEYYLKVKEVTKVIPDINALTHGNSFCNDNYNGYDLSYLCIKYLSQILDKESFKNLMSDFTKIKLLGTTIIRDMFNYFDEYINTIINSKK